MSGFASIALILGDKLAIAQAAAEDLMNVLRLGHAGVQAKGVLPDDAKEISGKGIVGEARRSPQLLESRPVRKPRVEVRGAAALETALCIFRCAACFVLVPVPPNLLGGGRPGAVDFANQEAREGRIAKIDQAELAEFVVLDGNVGSFGFPEYLYHEFIIAKSRKFGCEVSHSA